MWSQKSALQLVIVSSLLSLGDVLRTFPPGVTTPLVNSVRSSSMEDAREMRIVSALRRSVNMCVVSVYDTGVYACLVHISGITDGQLALCVQIHVATRSVHHTRNVVWNPMEGQSVPPAAPKAIHVDLVNAVS